ARGHAKREGIALEAWRRRRAAGRRKRDAAGPRRARQLPGGPHDRAPPRLRGSRRVRLGAAQRGYRASGPSEMVVEAVGVAWHRASVKAAEAPDSRGAPRHAHDAKGLFGWHIRM